MQFLGRRKIFNMAKVKPIRIYEYNTTITRKPINPIGFVGRKGGSNETYLERHTMLERSGK